MKIAISENSKQCQNSDDLIRDERVQLFSGLFIFSVSHVSKDDVSGHAGHEQGGADGCAGEHEAGAAAAEDQPGHGRRPEQAGQDQDCAQVHRQVRDQEEIQHTIKLT